jgi:agmatinase
VGVQDARVVVVGIPWEATTSYGRGTASGPRAIARASTQVDLFDVELGEPSGHGIAMLPPDPGFEDKSREASKRALEVIDAFDAGREPPAEALARVNALSSWLDQHVAGTVTAQLGAGKIVGVVGGDHSVAYGSVAAHAARYPGMGVLQFDAHADLRVAYQGFIGSHASVMHRVTSELDAVAKLVSVGVRDLCRQEHEAIRDSGGRVVAFFDADIRRHVHRGAAFGELAKQIADELPPQVYVSFDIDGLDPALCPNTGTPVPGGLSFHHAMGVLAAVVESGRRIVGFDLCEVAGDEWDANVGARVLYKLIGHALSSVEDNQ